MIKILTKLLYNEFGKFLISIILGLGLASLFRKACKNRNCLKFMAPPLDEITNNIYDYSNKCYKFKEKTIKCGSRDKTIEFA